MMACHDRWRQLYDLEKTHLKTVPLINCSPRAVQCEPMVLIEINLRLPDGRQFSQVCEQAEVIATIMSVCDMAEKAVRVHADIDLSRWVRPKYRIPGKRDYTPPLSHNTYVYVHPRFAKMLQPCTVRRNANVNFRQYIGTVLPRALDTFQLLHNYKCAFVGDISVTAATDLLLYAIQQKINAIEKMHVNALFGEPRRRQLIVLMMPERLRCHYESDWCRLETVSCLQQLLFLLQSKEQTVDVAAQ